MSEVKSFWCHEASNILCVRASDFDNVTRLFLDAAERAVASERREKELQQRLTAADEQIDLLSPRHTEQPEGKRERFEKWVMATKHPVFGFLDGRSLARGDDFTGYADEYVQGLWVAYLAFGVEQFAPLALALPERMLGDDGVCTESHYAKGWNDGLDELKRLNPTL
ncbi:MAG: hypothetical protein MUW57_21845 [Pseudomonas sp.]|nr:hypothetical protein [Pseudomonas sp.]